MSNFFKNLFENYEEQPAPDMWEKVMADVKHHNKVVRARKIAGVASLVVAGGVAALLLVNNNSENSAAKTMIAQETIVETVSTQVPESVVAENETMQPAAQAQQENKIVAPVSKNTTAQTQVAKAEAENTVAVATAEKTLVASTPEKQNVAVAEQTTKAEPSRAATNVAATATTTNNTLAETSQPAKTVVANKMRSGTNPDTTSNITDEQVKIIVPTAFTPDKSENNQFYVTCNHPDLVKSFELSIFTRNGLMVFHTKDINERWDGKYKGRVQNMGAYAYVLIYTTASGQKEVQKGSITIIR